MAPRSRVEAFSESRVVVSPEQALESITMGKRYSQRRGKREAGAF